MAELLAYNAVISCPSGAEEAAERSMPELGTSPKPSPDACGKAWGRISMMYA
jgi:hypothetical protein